MGWSKSAVGWFTVCLVDVTVSECWLVAHKNYVKRWKKSADFSIVPGSWVTVVLFQLFGLPCLFCARLRRSCLDDLKIFYYEQKLRSTQHPYTNADNRASDLLTMQTQSETYYNGLRLAIQAEMYTSQHTQHTHTLKTPHTTPHTPTLNTQSQQHYNVLHVMQTHDETLPYCSSCNQGKSSYVQSWKHTQSWEDIHRNENTGREIIHNRLADQAKSESHTIGSQNHPIICENSNQRQIEVIT